MNSVCISNCVNDTRVPLRATYVNLYKWPESDAEFVKMVGASGGEGLQHPEPRPRVVDSVSCRQLYLRSYTFSRKETVPERTKKCLGRVKERVAARRRREKSSSGGGGGGGGGGGVKKRCEAVRRVKELSCAAVCAIFQRLLSCTATIDVEDNRD